MDKWVCEQELRHLTMSSSATRRRKANHAGARSGKSSPLHDVRPGRRAAPYPTHMDESFVSLQPTVKLPIERTVKKHNHWPAARAGTAVVLTALLCVVLTFWGLGAAINDEVTAWGFDPERAQFLQFVIITLLGSFVAGFLLRWKAVAWLGGLLYYAVFYLIPYALHAVNPVSAVDGAPQLLIPGAFLLNLATLLAVALLVAGAGAVLGQACGEVFVKPFVDVVRFARARLYSGREAHTFDVHGALAGVPAFLLTVVVATAMLLTSFNIGDILNYGTSAAIYQPVQAAAEAGVVHAGSYKSQSLGGLMRQFLIYLPPSYTSAPDMRFPVIYMLHGAPGRMGNWFDGAKAITTANDLFSAGKASEAIFVSPDGNGPIYKISEWANSLDGRQRVEDSIVDDLVPFVDSHYRTIADAAHRTLAGISDGGFGAVNIALHHPGVFGKVLSLGGFFRAEKSPVFGFGPSSDAIYRYNSPAFYVLTSAGLAAARTLTFYIGAATNDRGYYPQELAFYRQLRQLGVHVTLIAVAGSHSWRTWGMQFARALPLLEPPVAGRVQSPTR